MKKNVIQIVLLVAVVCILISSCGKRIGETRVFKDEDINACLTNTSCELQLSNCIYDDAEYSASVSGFLKVRTQSGLEIIPLVNEKIVFKQVYGDVWRASVHDANDNTEYPIFALRKGLGQITSQTDLIIDGVLQTASIWDEYGDILFLISGDTTFLPYYEN